MVLFQFGVFEAWMLQEASMDGLTAASNLSSTISGWRGVQWYDFNFNAIALL